MNLIVVEAIRGRCASFTVLTATVSEIFGGQTTPSILVVGPYRWTQCYFFGILEEEEKFAGRKFREIPCAVDIYFAGGKFRAKSKFANIAKMSSTRKIRVIGRRTLNLECLH